MSITSPPQDYSTLFLDMNSFFASVEQQVMPALRGVPVGVAPYTGNSGCIIAASYEAKQLGIRIGRVGEMKKLCPGLKIVESRPALYMLYHKEIRRVIESVTPYFKVLSIDEFALHLTKREQNRETAVKLALELKKRITERVGDYLRCSIGIGPSTFLAKMAGERRKPDGLTVVTTKELEKFYSVLKLTDLVGINWRLEAHLKNCGIDSPLCLYQKSAGELHRVLNHPGRLWYFRLRGYEVDDAVVKNKTIGHSHVLAPEYRTKSGAMGVLRKLIFKAGYRLRREGYMAAGVSVVIGFTNENSFHLSRRVTAFADNNSFFVNVDNLLKSCTWRGQPVYIAVSTFNLIKNGGAQISIFTEVERAERLSATLDEINDEYGGETILPASMFGARESAPDRIPFGRPRYEIIH